MLAPEFARLRQAALAMTPAEARFRADVAEKLPFVKPGQPLPYAALFELNVEGTIASTLAVVDGTASLYLSNGTTILGAGDHASVKRSAMQLVALSMPMTAHMRAVSVFPTAAHGRVRFFSMTTRGVYSTELDEVELTSGGSPLSPLYACGQDLLTAIRAATEGV